MWEERGRGGEAYRRVGDAGAGAARDGDEADDRLAEDGHIALRRGLQRPVRLAHVNLRLLEHPRRVPRVRGGFFHGRHGLYEVTFLPRMEIRWLKIP